MIRFSNQQKALMWERWRQGDTLREVARQLERHPSSVFKKLSSIGGIQPVARSRSSRALSLADREVILRGLASHKFLRAIAGELNRAPSTISREVGRNGGAARYSERPSSVEDRVVAGHWEGDLIAGTNNSYIATLVERHSRLVVLIKVNDKTTKSVVDALIKQAKKIPAKLYKSLTWDRGSELADHKRFTAATNIDVYFADPGCPRQRGSNENTNRLLRQYLPKGTDLSVHSQSALSKIASELNERPRKTLDYETPAERFSACCV